VSQDLGKDDDSQNGGAFGAQTDGPAYCPYIIDGFCATYVKVAHDDGWAVLWTGRDEGNWILSG
jgi:hypothetical protein